MIPHSMANLQHNDDLTFHEIEYSFLIKEQESGNGDLINILRSELTRFDDQRSKTVYAENPISEFLKANIWRSVAMPENTKVYFTDYHEKDVSSFRFTLLVISGHVNFVAARQALDSLIKDTIGNYFEELIGRHLPVSVAVQCADNQIYTFSAGKKMNAFSAPLFRDKLPLILAALALFLSVTTAILWIVSPRHRGETIKPSVELRDKYYELLIEKKISDAFDKEKLDYLFYRNGAFAADTIRNNNSRSTK